MREYIAVFIFKIFKFFVKYTPFFIQKSFFSAIAALLYAVDKRRKKIAYINLDFAYEGKMPAEEKERIVKKCYKNLVFNLRDFALNQNIDKNEILKKVTIINEHYIQNAINRGEKIVFITAHYGNWELLSLAFGAKFGKISVIGRKLGLKKFDEILQKNREQFGITLIDKDKNASKDMLRSLKENTPIGILVDQNTADKEGELIDFFGKKARHTPVVSILARKFDALIVPIFIKTDDYRNFTVTLYEPFKCQKSQNSKDDILKCTQKQADITEMVIRNKPDEWFWFHRRWKNMYEEIYK